MARIRSGALCVSSIITGTGILLMKPSGSPRAASIKYDTRIEGVIVGISIRFSKTLGQG